MTIGAALLLLAAGAVLRFAVATSSIHGIDLHTIGDILMIVGVLGLVLWLVVWAPWARSRRPAPQSGPAYPNQGGPAYQQQQQPYQQQRPVPPADARTRDFYASGDPYYGDQAPR
jgi:hypothetical protein